MDNSEEDQRRQVIKARTEKIRAIRRKRILENANNRMDKVCKLQQWTSNESITVAEERRGEARDKEKGLTVEEEAVHESTPVEDPPDELVVLPRRQPSLVLPPPSLMCRWKAVQEQNQQTRLYLAMLTGVTASFAVGYSIPGFLCFITFELCVLTWTLISALMTRDILQPQVLGTVAMVKVAIGILYPPATIALDWVDQVLTLVVMVIQDMCVTVFSLVAVTALIHLLHPSWQSPH